MNDSRRNFLGTVVSAAVGLWLNGCKGKDRSVAAGQAAAVDSQPRLHPATAYGAEQPGTPPSAPSPGIAYPQSNRLSVPIQKAVQGVVANRKKASSIFLDTVDMQAHHFDTQENHYQGLARTHRLADGSVYLFLSYSDLDRKNAGQLMQFRYEGPLEHGHFVSTRPLTVAPLKELLYLNERHPSDILFFPDVNGSDSGYLLVTEEYDAHTLTVFHWEPGAKLKEIGSIRPGFPPTGTGPAFVFMDRIGDAYYLGLVDAAGSTGFLYSAAPDELFPENVKGKMNLNAFRLTSPGAGASFPVNRNQGPCQIKLVQDVTGSWYLLGYRAAGDENGDDFIDVYSVSLSPFQITRESSTHIYLPPGDTGFTSTGTHFVEPDGRLLVSSSYRWAENQSEKASFVTRVDECPSA